MTVRATNIDPTKRATTTVPNDIAMCDMKTECGSFIYYISKN